ncbi:unnamed protein product, partial [Iphiclides podalirius]
MPTNPVTSTSVQDNIMQPSTSQQVPRPALPRRPSPYTDVLSMSRSSPKVRGNVNYSWPNARGNVKVEWQHSVSR